MSLHHHFTEGGVSMNTTLTALVDWKEQKLYVNGVLILVDSLGGGVIDVTSILAARET